MQSWTAPRRRRWPLATAALVVLAGAGWTATWHYAAGQVETTVEGWKAREAQAGRNYTCASQTIGGFPFGIHVRCSDAGADMTSAQARLTLKAREILVSAQVWQPTVLTSTFVGPISIQERGSDTVYELRFRHAHSIAHGLPRAPERVELVFEQPVLERVRGQGREAVARADRLALDGRMLSGSAMANPVVGIEVRLAAAVAPELHPAAAAPTDADMSLVLRGLRDFAPKPWPHRLREMQAAGGRIDVTRGRVRQGDTLASMQGALGLSPQGRLDGQLQLTVANLEKLLPALGLDKALAQQDPNPRLSSAFARLDRIAPGLGDVARQNAAPMLVAGLAFVGRPTELEGQRAYALPLRFSDGAASLGPLPLGRTPPLF